MSDIIKQKAELRKAINLRRKEIPGIEQDVYDRAIFSRLVQLSEIKDADAVFAYYATRDEADTLMFINHLIKERVPVALPVTGDTELEFRVFQGESSLVNGKYNIPEPAPDAKRAWPTKKTVCLVPGLSFSEDGRRIGHGKGYYDRFLSTFPGKTIGLCYECFIGEVPADENDRKVDMIITEKRVIRRIDGEERV